MSYATLAQFKAAVAISDTVDDTDIQRDLDAASEWIEQYTGRVFGAFTASQARVFDPHNSTILDVSPDLATVSEVAVDEHGDGSFTRIIPSTQYQLYPLDVGQPGVNGQYNQIRLRPTATYAFVGVPGRQVRVTGTWGYGSTPQSIVAATILLANRYFRRPSAPFGVLESPQMGTFARLPQNDPDVKSLLDQFVTQAQEWVAV